MGNVSDAWYKRDSDAKQFQLEHALQEQKYAGSDKYCLHGIIISFHHTTDEKLTFSYPDGQVITSLLPGFDHPDPQRRGHIADYNFDGYDDVAFSFPMREWEFIASTAFTYTTLKLSDLKILRNPFNQAQNAPDFAM